MGVDAIMKLMEQCEKTDLNYFKCSYEGIELSFRKGKDVSETDIVREGGSSLSEAAKLFNAKTIAESELSISAESEHSQEVDENDEELLKIQSYTIGIFNFSDKIKSGDFVIRKGEVIGGIEAMKMCNDVIAPEDGEIVELLVQDDEVVECKKDLCTMRVKNDEKV